MAATIALAFGRGRSSNSKASRLGTTSAEAQANTYKTFTTAIVNKDGSGEVRIERMIGGERVVIHRAAFGPEEEEDQKVLSTVKVSGAGWFTGSPGVIDAETRATATAST